MSAYRYYVFDPTLNPVHHPKTVVSGQPGPHIGNLVDHFGCWRNQLDGLYPKFPSGDDNLIARYVDGVATNTPNMIVAASFVLGENTVPQIGAANRSTSTATTYNSEMLYMNCPTNQLIMGRFVGAGKGYTLYGTASFTPSASTEYTTWMATYAANASTDADVYGWMTTEAAWGTDLTARLGGAGLENHASLKAFTGSFGVSCLGADANTRVTMLRAWVWDGNYSALAWANSDPAGPKLKCTQVKAVGALSYQWYRSTSFNSGFTALAGATTSEWTDTTAEEGVTYTYYVVITAATSGAATSEIVSARKLPPTWVVGFIGASELALDSDAYNSVAQAMLRGTVPQLVQKRLSARAGRQVTISNRAISGTNSGQWVSGQTNMTNALSAFQSAGVTHVVVGAMGANDVTVPIDVPTHRANMQNIVNTLTNAGYKVLLGYSPLWFPGSRSGRASDLLETIQSYNVQNASIVSSKTGKQVRRGGSGIPELVIDYPGGIGDDMIHPFQEFADREADIYAAELYDFMTTSPGGGVRRPVNRPIG